METILEHGARRTRTHHSTMYVQEEMPTACVRFTIPFCDANRERETDSKTKKKKKTKQELWHYCDHLLASVFLSFFFFFFGWEWAVMTMLKPETLSHHPSATITSEWMRSPCNSERARSLSLPAFLSPSVVHSSDMVELQSRHRRVYSNPTQSNPTPPHPTPFIQSPERLAFSSAGAAWLWTSARTRSLPGKKCPSVETRCGYIHTSIDGIASGHTHS